MQDLKVALFQYDQAWQNPEANFSILDRLISRAPDFDLLVLPEMFNTGFTMNAKDCAESWANSRSLNYLKQASKSGDFAIYTSLAIQENEKYYNRGVFIHQGEVVAHYDKQNLFAFSGEDKVYSKGDRELKLSFKGWNIQFQICFDLRFPENHRNAMTELGAEYDLLLFVANWPSPRIQHWDVLLQARAIENQAFVLGVNRIGEDANQLKYNGHSQAFGPDGSLLDKMTELIDSFCVLELSKPKLLEYRKKLPFLPASEI